MIPIRHRAAAVLRSPAARRLARCLLGCALAAIATGRPARSPGGDAGSRG